MPPPLATAALTIGGQWGCTCSLQSLLFHLFPLSCFLPAANLSPTALEFNLISFPVSFLFPLTIIPLFPFHCLSIIPLFPLSCFRPRHQEQFFCRILRHYGLVPNWKPMQRIVKTESEEYGSCGIKIFHLRIGSSRWRWHVLDTTAWFRADIRNQT